MEHVMLLPGQGPGWAGSPHMLSTQPNTQRQQMLNKCLPNERMNESVSSPHGEGSLPLSAHTYAQEAA